MTAEQLVPDLQTCRKLKELGFPQRTLFMYASYVGGTAQIYIKKDALSEGDPDEYQIFGSAPTFAEIWDELPDCIKQDDSYLHGWLTLDKGDQIIGYKWKEYADDGWYNNVGYSSNIAQAAAELWINLKEKGIIS